MVWVALVAAAPALQAAPASGSLEQLREQVRWVPVQVGERKLATLDPASRLLLARSAAAHARLGEVGLDFRDVYGVIHAETSWVPRTGLGRNGVNSHGLAQFEPATARAVGLHDPDDAVAAVHAAAVLLREAALWSARRVDALGVTPQLRAAKLREGVSIYYNLSTRARSAWRGWNTHQLPEETRRHIANARAGALEADRLHGRTASGAAPLPPLAWAMLPDSALPARESAGGPQAGASRPAAEAESREARIAKANRVVQVAVDKKTGRRTWVFPEGTISSVPVQGG